MSDRYPWRDTSADISAGTPPQWETPGGAQEKVDTGIEDFAQLPEIGVVDDSITARKLRKAAVITDKIAPRAVTKDKVAPGAIGGNELDPALLENYGDIAVQGQFQVVNEQLADIALNIKNYGAVGDGVTDDTTAIKSAIADIKIVGRGSLYIPNGLYIITSKLSIPSNIRIYGPGTLKIKGGLVGFIMIASDDNVNGNVNIQVEDITIDGNRQTSVSNTEFDFGIDLRNTKGIYINRVTIKNCGGDGIYLGKGSANGCRNVLIKNSLFDNCNRNGISVIYGDDILITDNTFISLAGNPGAGVDIEPNAGDTVSNVRIINNMAQSCVRGFLAYGVAAGSSILNSFFMGNKAISCNTGIAVQTVSDFSIVNNKVFGCLQTGIVLETTTRPFVSGNEIVDCNTSNGAYFGLHLSSNNVEADITNNKIIVSNPSLFQTYNIYESAVGNLNNRIRNNVVFPFRTASIFPGGTGTIDVMNTRYDEIPNSSVFKLGNRKLSNGGIPSGSGVPGDVQFNNNPSRGGIAMWVYSSNATWEPIQMGVMNSIAAAPTFLGQRAIVGAIGYVATGTSSTADWKQITN